MGVHNPREHQHIDRRGVGAQQRPRAGVGRGAGGQDIVDQDHAAALNVAGAVGGDLERALDVARPLRPGQADLLLGRPDPPQRLRRHLHAALPLDDARQRAGLVVAAAPAAPPVQRYRDQHVGLVEQFAPGPRHPAAHRGREIGAVLVFQRMHQRARHVVIAHRGAGARIGRRIGDRFHRQQAGAGIVDKGNAEPRAKWRRDERQLGPARRRRRLRHRPVRGRRRTASAARCRARAAPHATMRPRQALQRAAQMAGDGTGWR